MVEAPYQTLVNYFPAQAGNLAALYTEALGLIPDGTAKMMARASASQPRLTSSTCAAATDG